MPVIPQQFSNLGKITVPYGGQTAYENFHPAVDIANTKGTPIKAPVSGVVNKVVSGKVNGDAKYGNLVTILDNYGNQHQLGHLDNPVARVGDQVQAGASPIGTMGNSGSAYSQSGQGDGTHLDYRIVSAYNQWKNPSLYIRNLGR